MSGSRRGQKLRTPLATATLATAILVGGTSLGLLKAASQEEPLTSAPVEEVEPDSWPRASRLGFPPAAVDCGTASPPLAPAGQCPVVATERPTPPAARAQERSVTTSPSPSPSRRVTSTGSCAASFYWEEQPTASGERFDPEAMTAAHKTLPFNTMVRVTNPTNGKSVTVRINDRGPYIDGRCLDLSRGAFRQIANLETGVLRTVHYEVLAR